MAAPASAPAPAAPRLLKALIVSSVGVAASHLVLSDTLYLSLAAQASAALGAGPGYSSQQAFTSALVNTFLLMPLVLWIGMRITGERKVGPVVLVGTAGWVVAVGNGIDAIDDRPGAILPLGSLLLVVGATALASLMRRTRT
ncbi:hypothetical protein GCM10010497_09530 [Streptomyces cinereoruber]|uniref:Uncharacterized protein n=1 Tax=Streptomyces cinereoruber TaxID=67260 RepID=A0AAV4KB68_9ACTN|nr:hypothetical protein [Streptomyces cinereoruber]MBB4156861.1 hypothetical protein [Streptomyces cinereoruber]MBY8815316.1 hypothetical protein [Streptomyces cinereoruber]NIH60041.1 hypothetical protein [Streptomyces cinereoruber]QEV34121.1 hypothetical protein CP977_19785 [Streptomyces cinereoruber]GGR09601.1 hypothetical protein GCM10010497_09530 [Streptomyces cinereoruber]